MFLTRRALTLLTALLALSMLACSDIPTRLIRSLQTSGSSNPVETPPPIAQQAVTAGPGATATRASALPPGPTSVPTPTRRAPNPAMVGMRTGLASLNSYQTTLRTATSGPEPTDQNEITMITQVDSARKASRTRTETREVSADSPKGSTDASETIAIGNQQCEISGQGASQKGKLTDQQPIESDLRGTLTGLLDVTLSAENPVFVAEETVNGIPSNHFTFKVTQLGKDSGAVVRNNKGDYWLARDGQYLVKYTLALEAATAAQGSAQAQTFKADVSYELSNVNAPMTIAFPAFCKK
ncbi:MAG: hypothetical protein ABIQ99_07910 [Thermoflexales bacterium]